MPRAKKKELIPFQNEIILLIGVPGSGKSTYANNFIKGNPGYVKLSRDEYRHMLRNEWYPGEEIEALVSANIDAATITALTHGYNVVLDNTHCNLKTVKETIVKFGKKARIVLKVIGAELTIKQIYAQNLSRDKAVPEAVIDRMYKGFKAVIKAKSELLTLINDTAAGTVVVAPYTQDPRLPKAIIVDIDGTVAHMDDRRGPFEWHKVGLDRPDQNVLSVIRALSNHYEIFFVSGRDGSCREETMEWLVKHYSWGINPGINLLMRPAGNFEKDSIIKERIFEQEFKGKYYIEMLFDDRNQVVEKYRSMGLTVAQVAEGDF